jgi:diguanylate cyclase (GGDEF)-like protein
MAGFLRRSLPKLRRAFLLGMGLLALVPFIQAAPAPLLLNTVREVRSLSPEQAGQSIPIHLTGVVTVPSTYKSSFFFMDATAGISVDRSSGGPAVHAGDRVEIVGASARGQFAPVVNATSIRVIGREKLPTPRLYELNELAGGEQDSQWISLRGVVRSAALQTVWDRQALVLELDIGMNNTIPVHVRDYPPTGWEGLPGSIVHIRGACGTIFNDHRQFVGLRLFASSLDSITIERPAPADPFDTPLVPLDQLLLFHARGGSIQRIRVEGTVTYSANGQEFFVQNGQRGILVRSAESAAAKIGSRVEVVGYLTAGRYSPELEDALFRPVAGDPARSNTIIEPAVASASNMVATSSDGFVASPFDSQLVRLQGRVVQEILGSSESTVILEDDNTIFSALMPRSGKRARTFAPGALLQVTGVCVTRFDSTSDVRHFRVLLRSPADIVVLEHAPWLTFEHAGWAVAVCLFLVLAGLGVRTFVRRDVELHTQALTDPLTGLYNRRGFFKLAPLHWERAQRRGSTLLIFYIDLDRFKEINDTFGHKAGDEALLAVADVLRGCFRAADVVARMGGDEFAVACDASADSPGVIEERLDSAVRRYNDRVRDAVQIALSVGVLVCDVSLKDSTIDELVARADEIMYARKSERRAQKDSDGTQVA